MATWGVLRLPAGVDAAAHAGDGAVAAGAAQHLDGLVAVAEGTTLAGLLALLPAAVTRIVLLDPATATDPDAADLLAAVLGADDGSHAAVSAARPLADALKRVDGDVIVEGLARDGMLTPTPPAVVGRAALDALAAGAADALAAGAAGEVGDLVGLILSAGHPVRMVPPDGAPITVRTATRTGAAL